MARAVQLTATVATTGRQCTYIYTATRYYFTTAVSAHLSLAFVLAASSSVMNTPRVLECIGTFWREGGLKKPTNENQATVANFNSRQI
jgi:hypothetical protein